MFFNVLADATEDTAELGAQAVGVARRAHNGIFDAIGLNNFLPDPVKNITDHAYASNQNILLGAGNMGATFLRIMDGGPSGQPRRPGSREDDEDYADAEEAQRGRVDHGPFPSPPDHRDYQYEGTNKPPGQYTDLRAWCPAVYDQLHMGSCTSNAVAGAFEFAVIRQGLPSFSPSRLFIWYHGRARLADPHAVKKCVGISIRDAIKSLNHEAHGVCSEDDWPYEAAGYDEKTRYFYRGARAAMRPPASVEALARRHTAEYRAISGSGPDRLRKLMQCLDSGHAFVFGMNTYGLLHHLHPDTYELRLPTAKEKKAGGPRHSLLVVGYIQSRKMFIVRNSWGSDWGDEGYFYMPFSYLRHCDDFWTIRLVKG